MSAEPEVIRFAGSDGFRDQILVGYSDEDNAWIAIVVGLAGISGIGDTPCTAIEQLLIALWGAGSGE